MARKFLNIGRGVRQDYPLSPYLFILSVEVLDKAIKKITGILVNQEEIELSQYARMTLLFGEVSGLNLNSNKTGSLWMAVPDPHPEIKEGGGGGLQKTFLGSKNKGGKGFRTPPLDPPLDWLKHREKRDSCS